MRFFALFFSLTFLSISSFSQEQLCKHFSNVNQNIEQHKKRVVKDVRMKDYDVTFYNLDLNVSNLNTNLSGFVESKVIVKKSNFNTLVFDLVTGFTIDSVVVNGIKKTSQQSGDLLLINLNASFQVDDVLQTKIYYRGKGKVGSSFPVGMMNGKNSKGVSYTFTASEPYHSYNWWPCKQDLEDKADSVYINITTENTNTVASNGLLKSTKTIGNKKRFEWKSYYPIQYYLIAFSCGPYYVKNSYAKPAGITDSILIQDFLYTSADASNYASQIASTKKLIELYSEKLGIYPFYKEKYGHFMAPSQVGALENQTITMIGDWYNQNTVNHELAHQWFGDNNTCDKWNEIWLHEGFASYFGAVLGEEFLTGNINFQNLEYVRSEITSAQSSKSTYVSDLDALDPFLIFDEINVYKKGAMILSMLRFELGDVLFFDVLYSFYQKNKGGLMNTQSLLQTVNEKSGKDYNYFFNQWVYGYGYPIYDVSYYQKGDSVVIETSQSTSSALTPFYKMGIDFNLIGDNDTLYVKDIHDSYNKVYHFSVPNFKLKSIQVNPYSFNLLKISTLNKIVLSNLKQFTSFEFTSLNAKGVITGDTVKITVPFNTDVTKLTASFTNSSKSVVTINSVNQISGKTVNNFKNDLVYTITAEDGSTHNYIVKVIIASKPKSSEKRLLSFEFPDLLVKGLISNNVINLEIPSNSDLKSIKAKFSVSPLAKLFIGNTEQISELTFNDFSKPIIYTVMAEDSSTVDYSISIKTQDPEDNLMLTFGFVGFKQTAIINGFAVRISLPLGTDISALNAVWTISNGAYVRYNNETRETSGSNNHDYTNPITYAVIGSGKSGIYKVFVTLKNEEPKSSENEILTYALTNPKVEATIHDSIIDLVVPAKIILSDIVAEFSLSPKAKTFVNQMEQVSGVTKNDFSSNLKYIVVAENGASRNYYVKISTIDSTKANIINSNINLYNVFPNPVSSKLQVYSPDANALISIFDAKGSLIDHKILQIGLNEMDVTHLFSGVYFVQVVNSNDSRVFKIQVNH
jgi:hypothetical protein